MSFVEVNVASPCGNVVLSRVDKRNALNREAISELAQAFSDLHQEKKVRAVILTGSGGNFCSGLDLNEMHTVCQGDSQTALARWHEDWVRLKDLLETMLRFPKPIIAAVDGVALGAGLGLVLGADIVLASAESVFGIPTARRGLISGVVPPLLNFRAGAKATARLLLTAEDISAEEAHRLSIVDEVLPASSLMNRAREYAHACAASPAESIQLSKRLLNETIGEQMLTQMSVGAAMGATSCTTEAAAEGLSAFIEKRAPLWP